MATLSLCGLVIGIDFVVNCATKIKQISIIDDRMVVRWCNDDNNDVGRLMIVMMKH